MGFVNGPGTITTNGLVFAADPANRLSYPGSGITMTNLISGTTMEMSLINGPVYNTGNAGYFEFDGTDDHGRIPVNSSLLFLNKASFTVDVWLYIVSSGGVNQFRRIINRETSGSPRNGYLVYHNENSNGTHSILLEMHGYLDDLVTSNSISSGTSFSQSEIIGRWNNFCWSYSSSFLAFYRNGQVVTSGTPGIVNITDTTMPVGICAYVSSFTSARLNARVGNVKFYNQALSATQVTQNFNSLRGRYGL